MTDGDGLSELLDENVEFVAAARNSGGEDSYASAIEPGDELVDVGVTRSTRCLIETKRSIQSSGRAIPV